MDCPACGLTNPPKAATCDCGYNFEERQPPISPGWVTDLSWAQRCAAYWAISWPALLAKFAAFFCVWVYLMVSGEEFQRTPQAVLADAIYPAIQFIMLRRIVRKDFRTFRLISQGRTLREGVQAPVAGPYAIGLAMKAKYRGFRLQGYGRA